SGDRTWLRGRSPSLSNRRPEGPGFRGGAARGTTTPAGPVPRRATPVEAAVRWRSRAPVRAPRFSRSADPEGLGGDLYLALLHINQGRVEAQGVFRAATVRERDARASKQHRNLSPEFCKQRLGRRSQIVHAPARQFRRALTRDSMSAARTPAAAAQ